MTLNARVEDLGGGMICVTFYDAGRGSWRTCVVDTTKEPEVQHFRRTAPPEVCSSLAAQIFSVESMTVQRA